MWRIVGICGFVWSSALAGCEKDPAPAQTMQPPYHDAGDGLSGAQRRMIASHVRSCWLRSAADAHTTVLVKATTDAAGTVTTAEAIASPGTNDPISKAVAQKAVAALLNPDCAHLPLPPALLGQTQTFTFEFGP